MSDMGQTPSQTVGPFFHYALPWKGCADLTGQCDWGARPDLVPAGHDALLAAPSRGSMAPGQVIEISGCVLDGASQAVSDALLEIWQANAAGEYEWRDTSAPDERPAPSFFGFGRCATRADGTFGIRTLMPGRVPDPAGMLQSPHLAVGLFARGLLRRLVTRIYFEDGAGLQNDSILARVAPSRRQTLIARRSGSGAGPSPSAHYRFDIRLQGESETVFFEF